MTTTSPCSLPLVPLPVLDCRPGAVVDLFPRCRRRLRFFPTRAPSSSPPPFDGPYPNRAFVFHGTSPRATRSASREIREPREPRQGGPQAAVRISRPRIGKARENPSSRLRGARGGAEVDRRACVPVRLSRLTS